MPYWRLLLDENLSPRVAERLLESGFYVVPLRDRGRLGEEDWDLLRWCFDQEFVLCTKNRAHFEREHERWQQRDEIHPGILILADLQAEEVYWSLRQFLENADPLDVLNEVVHIPAASLDYVLRHLPLEDPP